MRQMSRYLLPGIIILVLLVTHGIQSWGGDMGGTVQGHSSSPFRIVRDLARTYNGLSDLMPEGTRGLGGVAPLEDSLSKVYRRCVHGVVALVAPSAGMGSGIVVSDEGVILTNYHVASMASQVLVIEYDSTINWLEDSIADTCVVAKMFAVDSTRDLALLRVCKLKSSLKMLINEGASVSEGQSVFVIGHPLGLAWTLTRGTISKLRFDFTWGSEFGGAKCKANVIQTDAAISPGNSGGPLMDMAGHVIGMNSFATRGYGKAEGLGFAVRSNELSQFVDSALHGGYALDTIPPHNWLDSLSWIANDRDGDGSEDEYKADADGDGRYEITRMEIGYLRPVVVYAIDEDGDGINDQWISDDDMNGTPEHWQIDTDGDGLPDTDAWDTDGDGNIDKLWSTK